MEKYTIKTFLIFALVFLMLANCAYYKTNASDKSGYDDYEIEYYDGYIIESYSEPYEDFYAEYIKDKSKRPPCNGKCTTYCEYCISLQGDYSSLLYYQEQAKNKYTPTTSTANININNTQIDALNYLPIKSSTNPKIQAIANKTGIIFDDYNNYFNSKNKEIYIKVIQDSFEDLSYDLVKSIVNTHKSIGKQFIITVLDETHIQKGYTGHFVYDSQGNSRILMFIPQKLSDANYYFATDVLIHEMAHALQYALHEILGEEEMQSQWTEINKKIPYKAKFAGNAKYAFVKEYALLNIKEDISCTVAMIHEDKKLYKKVINDARYKPIKAKLELLQKWINKAYPNVKNVPLFDEL